MKCLDCKTDILAKDPMMCPYCGSKNIVSDDQAPDSEDIKTAELSSINVKCPYCGEIQPVESKTDEDTCPHCGKNYIIPEEILELL